MGGGTNPIQMAKGIGTAECAAATDIGSDAWLLLDTFFGECPYSEISHCAVTVFDCIVEIEACAACIDGSAINSTVCNSLYSAYSISAGCTTCPRIIDTLNTLVYATVSVGAVSLVACLSVIGLLFARSRDRQSMRDRIVMGLMLSNCIYSAANAIPFSLLRTSTLDCGQFALSLEAIRVGRSVWVCGKFTLVFLEMMILGTSTWALKRGARALPRPAEAALYIACAIGGAAAFAVFYIESARISAEGYNDGTQGKAQTGTFDHTARDDDADDDSPSIVASIHFDSSRMKYDALLQTMLQVRNSLRPLTECGPGS
jgi:hypothetical protein